MVWKSKSNGSKKRRVVVDTRKLNELIVPDAYPFPLQSDIIASVRGCTHLAILDAASFFYQWRLHLDFRYIFTLVTHRGRKTFQVPIIGYINSVAYVQREIDNIFREVMDLARTYVYNIICGAKSLDDLFFKLRILFKIFVAYKILIKPTKSFLNYQDVGLLGQRVNSLGLNTATEKLPAIKLLTYPKTLGALEYYLGLTGYLRSYIHFYVQLSEFLHSLKTRLLNGAPISGQYRRAYTSKIRLGAPTPLELVFFRSIQDALSEPSTLVHYDSDKILWIDLDGSKEFGFGVVVFPTKTNERFLEGRWPSRSSIRLVIFLSQLLIPAERNYWPTELEIAGFVWVLKRVRHVVESSRSKVIVQTDHSAILDITQQPSITSTNSTTRINVRLVKASQYLHTFSKLEICHKPSKEHIVPDALSRLASANTNLSSLDPKYSEPDALFTYITTLVDIQPDLIKRIIDGYKADEWWSKPLC